VRYDSPLEQQVGTNRIGLTETPILDALKAVRQRKIVSFHALPLSQMENEQDLPGIDDFNIISSEFIRSLDMTYTGALFDNPVVPKKCIEESTLLTASAFSADYTAYITCGTTIANYIAVNSLTSEGDRVLVERSSHQSIHFALIKNKNKVTYIKNQMFEPTSGRYFMDTEAMLQELRSAKEGTDPYKLVILNGCSYEGVLKNQRKLLEQILSIDESVSILIDEAWLSFGYFHNYYEDYCALKAARSLGLDSRTASIIVTQSAHKTLLSIRQGSYLHMIGSDTLRERIRCELYSMHTTSPSYPILASLELARADAAEHGYDRVEDRLKYVDYVRQFVSNTEGYSINESAYFCDEYQSIDPLKMSINVSQITTDVKRYKEALFDKFDIYIKNITDSSFLVAIHYGITEKRIKKFIKALYLLANTLRNCHLTDTAVDLSDEYIIPYPPGIPLLVPGEQVSYQLIQQIDRLKKCGIDIFSVKGRRP